VANHFLLTSFWQGWLVACLTIETVKSKVLYINAIVTVNLLECLKMLPGCVLKSGNLSNNRKIVITTMVNIMQLSLSTCFNFFTSSNPFHMYNKVFSLNLDMANPNSLLFLGNIQWKLVNNIKTVIYRLFSILQLSLPFCSKF